MVHCILDTMSSKGTAHTLRRTMHIHPTISELVPTVFGELRPAAIAPLLDISATSEDASLEQQRSNEANTV